MGCQTTISTSLMTMLNTILGSKLKMTQVFSEGSRVPVTLVQAGPCVVTDIKINDRHGYWALQLGFGTKKLKNTSKPLQGHLKATTKDNKLPRTLKEVILTEQPSVKIGDSISLTDILTVGDTVTVTGVSKGKGFAGAVKRWRFRGGSKTHGQSDRWRAPGSIGQGTTPGRVYKGKHMAGRMGGDQVTLKNLHIIEVHPDDNTIAISGAIPGNPGSIVVIKRTSESKVSEVAETPEAPIEETVVVEPVSEGDANGQA